MKALNPSATSARNVIDTPADLRRMPTEKLPAVCAEIRDFLINSLSTNPGHFASSMGAVELTVALHYVFNTPTTALCGMSGIRPMGTSCSQVAATSLTPIASLAVLAVFPIPKSPYDTFTAGHASNSISAALGMAMASELNNDKPRRNVVAVIGDASISGGLAFEGLNNASINKNNLLIILNDNDMSIDRNVGALNSYLAHLNTTGPTTGSAIDCSDC